MLIMDWEYEFESYFVLETLRSSILQTYNASCLTEKNSIIITIDNCLLQLGEVGGAPTLLGFRTLERV